MSQSLAAHPDRLLPADPGTRSIARSLQERVQGLPTISPHGHVDAAVIEQNTPFPDPAALLVSPDHYVTRLIYASGVPTDRLRDGAASAPTSRGVWRTFVESWPLLYPGDKPGIGVEFNEEAAAAYPYQQAYLPYNRLVDGTVHDW